MIPDSLEEAPVQVGACAGGAWHVEAWRDGRQAVSAQRRPGL